MHIIFRSILRKMIVVAFGLVFVFLALFGRTPKAFAQTVDTLTKTNWGGYIAYNDRFYSQISAVWTVPCISWSQGWDDVYGNYPNPTQKMSVWVGLGGEFTGDNLVQVGTSSVIQYTGGGNYQKDYYAWEENLATQPNVVRLFNVHCGDHISGIVTANAHSHGGMYISDQETNQTIYTVTGPPAGGVLGRPGPISAEAVIEKHYSGNGTMHPLPDFTPVKISNPYVTDTGGRNAYLSDVVNHLANLVNDKSGIPEVFVSNIGNLAGFAGGGFTVTKNDCVTICG